MLCMYEGFCMVCKSFMQHAIALCSFFAPAHMHDLSLVVILTVHGVAWGSKFSLSLQNWHPWYNEDLETHVAYLGMKVFARYIKPSCNMGLASCSFFAPTHTWDFSYNEVRMVRINLKVHCAGWTWSF